MLVVADISDFSPIGAIYMLINDIYIIYCDICIYTQTHISLCCLLPAVGSLARVLSKALVTDWNKFIFWVGPKGFVLKGKGFLQNFINYNL